MRCAAGLAAIVELVGCGETGPRSPEEQRAFEAAQRAKTDSLDQVRFTAFFAASDTNNVALVLEADAWAERTKAPVRNTAVFTTIHRRAVRAHLDSADALLRGDLVSNDARHAGRMQLVAAFAPLSAADSARKAKIDTRWRSLTRRAAAALAAAEEERRRALAEEMVDRRKSFAATLENRYLDQGLNVTVTTRGKSATTLHLKWIFVSRVVAHQLSKGDLIPTLREMGFKRFEISDGYDESWFWTL